MTGLLLAFTGWAIAITTQSGGTCVAHGFSNVANIMGYETTPDKVIQDLGVSYQTGYNVGDLPRNMTGIYVSYPRQYTKHELIGELSKEPLLGSVFNDTIVTLNKNKISSHAFAVVGSHVSGAVIANSWSTRRGLSGYDIIGRDQLDRVYFQKIGNQPIIKPSLIQLERKLTRKERIAKRKSITNSISGTSTNNLITSTPSSSTTGEKSVIEKLPDTNTRRLKIKFLKPLD